LATEKIQPQINRRRAKSKIKKHIANGFLAVDGIDAIYYSSAPRAKETAALLADALNVTETKELGYLHEIAFSPKKLVSDTGFEWHGMHAVREAVYEAVAQGTTDEAAATIIGRIQKIERLLANNKDRTIVIVTHGFFMRLLQIALLQNKLTFSVSDQRQAVNYGYLQGFAYEQ
jgi:broad specificity phosphatase PhoE